MSVEFSNAYQEILLENLMAIIKQNFMLQTQLKITEKVGEEKNNLQKRLDEVSKSYLELQGQLEQFQVYKNKAEQNSTAHEEKSRIQTALNEEMKKSLALKNENEAMKETNKSLSETIAELEAENKKLKSLIPEPKVSKRSKAEQKPVTFEAGTF